jgi:hypothetical protein
LSDWHRVRTMPKLNPEQWAEIRCLFEQSSALPPEARAAFLEQTCANEDLRREVVVA